MGPVELCANDAVARWGGLRKWVFVTDYADWSCVGCRVGVRQLTCGEMGLLDRREVEAGQGLAA